MACRTVFMGTAEIACTPLRTLHELEGIHLTDVVTQPDKPGGRKLKLQPSPVKIAAQELGLAIHQPESLRNASALEFLTDLQPDLFIVMAYGQILPESVLGLPIKGALNLHASLLPRHRGAAPIQRAILEGDQETGITLMQMEPSLDTGAMIAVLRTPIGPDDNSQTIHDRLAALSGSILEQSLSTYLSGQITPVPQDHELATYAKKVTKSEGRIDWRQPAIIIDRQIRAFAPWPGAFTDLQVDTQKTLKIHAATLSEETGEPGIVLKAEGQTLQIGCGTGSLYITQLQREGSRPMSAADFLNGQSLRTGDSLN